MSAPATLRRPRRARLPGSSRARRLVGLLILLLATAALAVFALGLGDYPLSPGEVLGAALDPGAGFKRTIVLEWRLPRVALALLIGAALAVSGALFQSLTDNPLGSPDIIGFTSGSYTGAILALTVLGAGLEGAAVGALLGGLATAGVVLALTYRRGIEGFRLIIVGIGVTAMLTALNQWLLLRAQEEVAMSASIWGAGSLANSSREAALTAGVGVAVLLVLVVAVSAPLRQLELGDDLARSHGVRAGAVRLSVVLLGVALVALAVATSGPIAFVALTAPQIAARLLRSPGLPLTGSALTGAFLLLGADMLAQHAVPGGVPVGTVTTVLGGVYLVTLLIREARKTW
jgi:iron complex transport system permease protein